MSPLIPTAARNTEDGDYANSVCCGWWCDGVKAAQTGRMGGTEGEETVISYNSTRQRDEKKRKKNRLDSGCSFLKLLLTPLPISTPLAVQGQKLARVRLLLLPLFFLIVYSSDRRRRNLNSLRGRGGRILMRISLNF